MIIQAIFFSLNSGSSSYYYHYYYYWLTQLSVCIILQVAMVSFYGLKDRANFKVFIASILWFYIVKCLAKESVKFLEFAVFAGKQLISLILGLTENTFYNWNKLLKADPQLAQNADVQGRGKC